MASESLGLPVIDACWNRIGIHGDRSCPELTTVIHCNNCPVFSRAAQTLLDRPVQQSYLAELAQFVAEPAVVGRTPDQAVVLFSIDSERFAIPSQAVIEVTEACRPRPVPHRSNQVFAGLVNIRGQLELCMSLSGLLGLSETRGKPSGEPRVLMFVFAEQRWVLLIDAVLGVHRFHDTNLLNVPPASLRHSQEYIKGLLEKDGVYFGLLDLARVCAGLRERLG